jgi:hypothetical protein
MPALDRLVPGPHLLEIDRIDLAAPAARVWERVRHGELAQSLPMRALFAIRGLASGPRTSLGASSTIRIEDLKSTREHPGFQILVDDPPHEMAVAAIGKVWRLDIPFMHVANADEYAAFAQPGFIKVAWAIRVLPRGEQRSHMELELRVVATDVGSWRRFRRYFRLIGPFSRFIRHSLLRSLARDFGRLAKLGSELPPASDVRTLPDRWSDVLQGISGASRMALALVTPFLRGRRAHWGLDPDTAARVLPGDDLIPEPRWSWTHGIEIDTAAEDVWPWIGQIGADRGGFSSYQWLENLTGCRVRNTEKIHPQWEANIERGLMLHPDIPPLRIVSLVRGRHLVAHAPAHPSARANGKPWVEASWLFLVEPLGPTRCRFVSRYRVACSNDVTTRLSFGPTFVEAIGFAMDRRMLLGVKQRAEASRLRVRAA